MPETVTTKRLVVIVADWMPADDPVLAAVKRFRDDNPEVEVGIAHATESVVVSNQLVRSLVPGIRDDWMTPVVGRKTADGVYEAGCGEAGVEVLRRAIGSGAWEAERSSLSHLFMRPEEKKRVDQEVIEAWDRKRAEWKEKYGAATTCGVEVR